MVPHALGSFHLLDLGKSPATRLPLQAPPAPHVRKSWVDNARARGPETRQRQGLGVSELRERSRSWGTKRGADGAELQPGRPEPAKKERSPLRRLGQTGLALPCVNTEGPVPRTPTTTRRPSVSSGVWSQFTPPPRSSARRAARPPSDDGELESSTCSTESSGDTVDDSALARGESARGRGERDIHAVATARGGPLWFTCDDDDDDDDGRVAACATSNDGSRNGDTSYGENSNGENSSSDYNDAGRAGGDGDYSYGDHDNDDLVLHEDIAGSCPGPDPDDGGDWGWFSQGGEHSGAVARCTTPEQATDRTPRARSATPPSPTRVGHHHPHPHSHQHQNEHQTEEAVEDKDESTEDDASMDNDARSSSRHGRRRPSSAWDAYSKSHESHENHESRDGRERHASGSADNENTADTDVACGGDGGYLRLDFIGTAGDLVVRPHELIEFVMGSGGSLSSAVDFERRYSSPFAGRAESCASSPYSPPSIGSSPRHTGTMGREAGSSFPYSFS